MTRSAQRQALRSHARRERHIILHSLSIFTTIPRVVKINKGDSHAMGKRVGAVGSLATAARNRESGNAVFPLLLFRYVIADKISAENKVPSFYGPERRVLIYAEVNSTRRRLRCRLFEIFN